MKSDAEIIAEWEENLISPARILIQLRPGEFPPAPPADLGDPESGFRYETDREYVARIERMRAAEELD